MFPHFPGEPTHLLPDSLLTPLSGAWEPFWACLEPVVLILGCMSESPTELFQNTQLLCFTDGNADCLRHLGNKSVNIY